MGIEIPPEVAASEQVPEDLDSGVRGPYRFPSPKRRRISGSVYLATALLIAVGAAAGLPAGLWAAAAGMAILGLYHFATAWSLSVDDTAALQTAGRSIDFAVGHASAALTFEGVLSRPVWSVLIYSADDPPSTRALVRIDARTGALRHEPYVEEIEAP